MKSILQQIAYKTKLQEKTEEEALKVEIANPSTNDNRRNFLKKAALGGLAIGGMMNLSIEDTIAQTTSKVSRSSYPSDLKITDMRYCVPLFQSTRPIIRIDTNQGIYGLGEVRGGADLRYALFLKSRILGQNPSNVEMLFKSIKQFGFHGRQGAGVCAVEMALWDLVGKAYEVPCWLLLGGKYRDKIRIYADTPIGNSPEDQKEKIKSRIDKGYTWLKLDLGINEIKKIPGTLVNDTFWEGPNASQGYMAYENTSHPFTGIQITEKGLEELAKIVENVRNIVGYEIPISSDHFGHFDVNNCIRLGESLEKYRLAWLEDMVPWQMTDQLKMITDALKTPICTGEDIYLLNSFKPLLDTHAIDIIQPDLAAAGGLLETKKIGDYAEEKGIAMAMHFGGSPVTFMANVHCAAATQNFLALEHHQVDLPWWEDLVKVTGKEPLITNGFGNVPLDAPGLGIELNDEEVKKHLHPDFKGYFEPTPEWDQKRSNDRLWS